MGKDERSSLARSTSIGLLHGGQLRLRDHAHEEPFNGQPLRGLHAHSYS